jgi:molybdopterin synthase catalytic subunit
MKQEYLVDGPLTPSLISGLLTQENEDTASGAVSVFIGKVRADENEGTKVTAIEYSAYPEMAETETEAIISLVRSAFSDVRSVMIVHSTGIVKAGEASLFIMVTAGHRDHATRACRHTLELVKERLPVWKKEHYSDSAEKWK